MFRVGVVLQCRGGWDLDVASYMCCLEVKFQSCGGRGVGRRLLRNAQVFLRQWLCYAGAGEWEDFQFFSWHENKVKDENEKWGRGKEIGIHKYH